MLCLSSKLISFELSLKSAEPPAERPPAMLLSASLLSGFYFLSAYKAFKPSLKAFFSAYLDYFVAPECAEASI